MGTDGKVLGERQGLEFMADFKQIFETEYVIMSLHNVHITSEKPAHSAHVVVSVRAARWVSIKDGCIKRYCANSRTVEKDSVPTVRNELPYEIYGEYIMLNAFAMQAISLQYCTLAASHLTRCIIRNACNISLDVIISSLHSIIKPIQHTLSFAHKCLSPRPGFLISFCLYGIKLDQDLC